MQKLRYGKRYNVYKGWFKKGRGLYVGILERDGRCYKLVVVRENGVVK